MRWLQSKGWGVVPTLLAIGLGLLVFLLNPVPVQVLRNFMFDQYQRWQSRPYVSAPVRIIDIDDESLQRLGQWPWPRTRVAELISRLQEAQASAIAVDILFAEPDRTSPKAALDAWGASARIREAVSGLPDHDTVLADVIGKGRVVLGVSLDRQMDAPATPVTTPFAATSAARYASVGESALGYVHQFSSARTALPMFVEQAAGNGAMTFEPDSDGVVRRVPLLVQVGEHLAPTLSAEALRVSQGASNYVTRAVPSGGVGLEEVRVGRLTLPTTPPGRSLGVLLPARPQPLHTGLEDSGQQRVSARAQGQHRAGGHLGPGPDGPAFQRHGHRAARRGSACATAGAGAGGQRVAAPPLGQQR
jgi:adenylate cyclase